MADVGENAAYTDAATAISQGKRHLLVQDYTAAVTALAEGLELMAQKLGDCDDELGEPYLLYGRALLGLAREEVGVLGGGVPGSEDTEEDEECDDDEEDDNENDNKSETDPKDEETPNNESDEKKTEKMDVDEEKKIPAEKQEPSTVSSSSNKDNEKVVPVSNKTDDKKIEEIKMVSNDNETSKIPAETSENVVVPGTSKDIPKNGVESTETKITNGKAGKSTDPMEEDDDVNKEDDDEDPGRGIDLQVAWEVLELAKIVFTKRGETGLKYLAETHRLLGEVAMESDNPQGAIADLEGALELLEKLEPCEPRAIADIHYQLGLAHSMANDFDASIQEFGEATKLLEARIKQLEDSRETTEETKMEKTVAETNRIDDPFYTIEGEIKQLRELLPAIREKIVDMKDFKEEACRLVIEGIKNKVASGGCTNGSSSSSSSAAVAASSSSGSGKIDEIPSSSEIAKQAECPKKPASDISHLVRKKRKNDNDTEEVSQSPCKKTPL